MYLQYNFGTQFGLYIVLTDKIVSAYPRKYAIQDECRLLLEECLSNTNVY